MKNRIKALAAVIIGRFFGFDMVPNFTYFHFAVVLDF
jgi:hypothetical protein